MPEFNIIELIGYLGSVVVAISLTMTSMIKLRWLNLLGSIIFTIYGFIINAIPIALVNMLIIGVNIVFMIKFYNKKEFFKILEIKRNSQYLNSFLEFYQNLILKDFPNIKSSNVDNGITVLILRNMAVVGVFMGKMLDSSTMEIEMDFVIPQYRDFKAGKYLLVQNQSFFKNKGILNLRVDTSVNKYGNYFRKMGFRKENNNDENYYVKELS